MSTSDAMKATMTVTVKMQQVICKLSVKYSGAGGFASSADDKVFNNPIVAPVKPKFDFHQSSCRSYS